MEDVADYRVQLLPSEEEAREELAALRPDVLRVAAGLAATMDRNGGDLDGFAGWCAEGALAIVRAVDRVCGGGE